MALVDYSGSESSNEEEPKVTKPPPVPQKPKSTSQKPAFQKVVDSSEPHKIRISLPEPSRGSVHGEEPERPAKRAKVGSGEMSGFNSLLPAPKRATASNAGSSLNGTKKGGLGAGINLRTGATPGFSREPEPSFQETENGDVGESTLNVNGTNEGQNPKIRVDAERVAPRLEKQVEEPKGKGKLTMFKPLSVARKPQKKKAPSNSSIPPTTTHETQPRESKPAPKVSLFSTGDTHGTPRDSLSHKGPYQPIAYQSKHLESEQEIGDANPENEPENLDQPPYADPSPQASDSLDTIASDLNLSASAKRQLLGRQKNHSSAINIVNFNTDEEYKANEAARQAGEQVQHNPVRAIAPGKHSLKQLVNMGAMQADALEESFASGRRNRSEAGSKYGW